MLTPEQVERARNWMYARSDSHLADGYERLRRHMIVGGVDLPWRLTKEHTETEQHLWCLYFDVLQEFVKANPELVWTESSEEDIERVRKLLHERRKKKAARAVARCAACC
jgi:hypothetical protein